MEDSEFFLKIPSKEDIIRIRNIRKRRLINTKIKSLKNKVTRYKSRKEDIEEIQTKVSKGELEIDLEKEENMLEEIKLIHIYIKEYEELIIRLQKEYCNIKI